MKLNTIKEAFVQVNENGEQDIFEELMRKSIRLGLLEVLEKEIDSLCGKKHHLNKESSYYRAGSETGSLYANGKKEEFIRPRVREQQGAEVKLTVYEEASKQRNIFDEVVRGLAEVVSSRGVNRATQGAISKSSASRMWAVA